MEIVLSNQRLGIGGGETYLLTVAEQLQRLGHQVTIFILEPGDLTEAARRHGLRAVDSEDRLPDSCDIVYAQESATAFVLADRFPTTPLVYAVHADEYDLCVPPQLPEITSAVVATNERVARRIRAFALAPEVVRLRQPVDTQRFAPRARLRTPPRRALLLGNYLLGDRRDLVVEACEAAGLEWEQIGGPSGRLTNEPETVICEADIVFGKARVIVEAMACGRAAYVYDHNGGDGWVTPERYPILEADNFGGQAEPVAIDAERLLRDLAEYTPQMGLANRDLAIVNHSANRHAQELVSLFRRLRPRKPPAAAPLREMSRLVRLQWASESRAIGLSVELQDIRTQLEQARREIAALSSQLTEARSLAAEADERASEAEVLAGEAEVLLGSVQHERAWLALELESASARAEDLVERADWLEARALAAEQRERALLATRRYRFGKAAARPLDLLRRRGA